MTSRARARVDARTRARARRSVDVTALERTRAKPRDRSRPTRADEARDGARERREARARRVKRDRMTTTAAMPTAATTMKARACGSRRAIAGKGVVATSRIATPARRGGVATYAGKGKAGGRRGGPASQMQQQVEQFMPPIDPDNEQFVIHVRSKRGIKAWYPLNVVTGGSAANTLVKGLDNDMSKEMAQKSLSQNIGKAIYKDMAAIDKVARSMPMLKQAKEIEYGFSVLDKENPRSMFSPANDKVWLIPSEEECETPADKFQEMGENMKKMFGQ